MLKKTFSLVIVCFSICYLLFGLPVTVLVKAVQLPIIVNFQGFTITITYYSITDPYTLVLVGSIENDGGQTVKLMSLSSNATINGMNVAEGSIDQSYLTLTGGVAVPASATIHTQFNTYNAFGKGVIVLEDGTSFPFGYNTTLIHVAVTAWVCVPSGVLCIPWPSPIRFDQTATLAQLTQ
jgi:hypothetical protein